VGRRPGQRKHGTRGGWEQHRRAGTEPCMACKVANRASSDRRNKRGRCAPGLGWPLLPAATWTRGTP
jgi:hypothetical protein